MSSLKTSYSGNRDLDQKKGTRAIVLRCLNASFVCMRITAAANAY
jgi:hypothetical protein